MTFLLCSKCQVEMYYQPFLQTVVCPKCLGHDPDQGDDNGNDCFTYRPNSRTVCTVSNERY